MLEFFTLSNTNFRVIIFSSVIVLDVIEDGHVAKYLAMTFSFVTFLFRTPILFTLVQYEQNCHNRILINRYPFTSLHKNNPRTLDSMNEA